MPHYRKILAALLPLDIEGKKELGDQWHPCLKMLFGLLKRRGCEETGSDRELTLFNFLNPVSALFAVFSSLKKVKKEFGWEESNGRFPLKIVFHFQETAGTASPISKSSSNLWLLLNSDTPYVTRSLKLQWDALTDQTRIGPCSFEEEGEGVYELKISASELAKSPILFPQRTLAIRGQNPSCFYCGMNTHHPSKCPSKSLPLDLHGLKYAGYQQLDSLSKTYSDTFKYHGILLKRLEDGVTSQALKSDNLLQVFMAYFDIFEIFQLRFFWKMAFIPYGKWRHDLNVKKIKTASGDFLHAYDALRLGKFIKAKSLFAELALQATSKDTRFYATIGQALAVIEKGNLSSAVPFLRAAISLAEDEKGRVYSHLLLLRVCWLNDDFTQAGRVLDDTLKLKPDCLEASYLGLLIKMKFAHNEELVSSLLSLATSHERILFTLILDPQLQPIEGLVYDVLLSKLQELNRVAAPKFAQVRAECNEAISWFGEDHKQAKQNLKILENIKANFVNKSIFGLADVISKSDTLLSSCQELIDEGVSENTAQLEKLAATIESLQRYWTAYRWKSFFKDIPGKLQQLSKKITKASALHKKMKGESFQASKKLITDIKSDCQQFRKKQAKMQHTQKTLDLLLLFFKNLLTTELAVTVAVFVLILLYNLFQIYSGSEQLLNCCTGSLQYKLYFFSAVVIAPALAIGRTIKKLGAGK